MQDTQTQDTFTDLDDNMQPQPKTNDIKLLGKVLSKALTNNQIVAKYALKDTEGCPDCIEGEFTCDKHYDEWCNSMLNEARRSAIEEAIAKLEEIKKTYKEYWIINAAKAALEKKPLEKASAKPTYDGVFEYVECKHCDRPIHKDVNGKWEHNHSGVFDCEVSAEPQATTKPKV